MEGLLQHVLRAAVQKVRESRGLRGFANRSVRRWLLIFNRGKGLEFCTKLENRFFCAKVGEPSSPA
jgi:hypothetical protein